MCQRPQKCRSSERAAAEQAGRADASCGRAPHLGTLGATRRGLGGMARKASSWRQVLVYSPLSVRRDKIKRHYLNFREESGLPYRCDNPDCRLHLPTPCWNGEPLVLVLDHIDGNKLDNRPEQLRLLCPNCDSQLSTKGGRNIGKIERVGINSFTLKNSDGTRHHSIIGSVTHGLRVEAEMEFVPAKKSE